MDHLPKINDPAFPPSVVPYLCENCPYDGPTPSLFREKKGWQIVNPDNTSPYLARAVAPEQRPPNEITAFIQAWMFFGMLTEVFKAVGVDVNQQDFIASQRGGGRPLISTALLPEYIDRWTTASLAAPTHRRIEQLHRTTQLLHECGELARHMLARGMVTYGRVIFDDDPESKLVVLSIMLLGDSLETARARIYRALISLAPAYERRRPFGARSVVSDELYILGGWCPSTIHALRNDGAIDSIAYHLAAYLRGTSMSNNHERCSSTMCRASILNVDTYTTLHVGEACKCELISVDIDEVVDIILGGEIPCVELKFDEYGELSHLQVSDKPPETARFNAMPRFGTLHSIHGNLIETFMS